MGGLFYAFFFEKKAFWLLALPKQMLFLTIFNKKHFFKTKSTRLGVIVAPNKGPEYVKLYTGVTVFSSYFNLEFLINLLEVFYILSLFAFTVYLTYTFPYFQFSNTPPRLNVLPISSLKSR